MTSSPPWLSLRKNWMFWGERLQFKSTNKWKATFQIVFCYDADGKENYLHILELDKHKRNHFLTIQLLACQNNVLGKRLSMVSWVGSSQSCIIRMDYIIIHYTWTLVIVSAPEKSRVLGRFLNTLNIFDDHQLFVIGNHLVMMEKTRRELPNSLRSTVGWSLDLQTLHLYHLENLLTRVYEVQSTWLNDKERISCSSQSEARCPPPLNREDDKILYKTL